MKPELKLISMKEIPIEMVRWLWYPYIPLGKLTLVQGDPGQGKTTFALAVIASLTRGEPLPGCPAAEPMNVIYQTAEDGLADTIKPRLVASGADCSRVLVINEDEKALSFCDARLEEAVRQTGARLVVLSRRTSARAWICTAPMRCDRDSNGWATWRSVPCAPWF